MLGSSLQDRIHHNSTDHRRQAGHHRVNIILLAIHIHNHTEATIHDPGNGRRRMLSSKHTWRGSVQHRRREHSLRACLQSLELVS